VDACGLHSTRLFSSLRMIEPIPTSRRDKSRLRRYAFPSANRSPSVFVQCPVIHVKIPTILLPARENSGTTRLGLRGNPRVEPPVGANREKPRLRCFFGLGLVRMSTTRPTLASRVEFFLDHEPRHDAPDALTNRSSDVVWRLSC
jgi:hypothetical protein